MKKRMLIGWVTITILLAFGTSCFAFWASNVANTTKRGSFLIFPLIKAGEGRFSEIDTVVSISNDAASSVFVKCFYKYPRAHAGLPPCLCEDFGFTLTAYQEISFSVKTGLNYDGNAIPRIGGLIHTWDGNQTGELKCFAVDNKVDEYPISHNFLKGEATISEGPNMTYQYHAWGFAVGAGIGNGSRVIGSKGGLQLTGTYKTYDACPSKLIFPFIQNTQSYVTNPPTPFTVINSATGGPYRSVENVLTLVPCKQDCVSGSEGNNTITNVELLVYDEYENPGSGAWACVGCDDASFFSESLRSSKLHNPSVFTTTNGGPPSKIFTVRARALCPPDANCDATSAVPVIGVISHQFYSPAGPIAGETPTATPYFNPYDNHTLYGQGWLMGCNGDNQSTPVTFTYK
jgi:hypothetical protein